MRAGAPPSSQSPVATEQSTKAEQDIVLERGGELGPEVLFGPTLVVGDSEVIAVGMSELPADSRLQMAFAGVDAIVRAEVAKALLVSVEELDLDVSSNKQGLVNAERVGSEIAHSVLPQLPSPRRGWMRIRRGETELLVVFAELTVDKAALTDAVARTLARLGHNSERAPRVVGKMHLPEDEP